MRDEREQVESCHMTVYEVLGAHRREQDPLCASRRGVSVFKIIPYLGRLPIVDKACSTPADSTRMQFVCRFGERKKTEVHEFNVHDQSDHADAVPVVVVVVVDWLFRQLFLMFTSC